MYSVVVAFTVIDEGTAVEDIVVVVVSATVGATVLVSVVVLRRTTYTYCC